LELTFPQILAARLNPAPAARPDRVLQRGELKRIAPDHQIAHRLQIGCHSRAAVRLADTGDAVVADDLDDRAKSVGRVQPRSSAQRRVAESDRRDAVFDDLHVSPIIDKMT
jgi:hypothetical protein